MRLFMSKGFSRSPWGLVVVLVAACSSPRLRGADAAGAPAPVASPAPELPTPVDPASGAGVVGEDAPAAPACASASPAPEAPGPAFPDVPFTIHGEQDRVIEVYPPLSTQGRWPLVVLLHATCMQPGPVCDAFGHAGRDVGWLVCPAGNSACYGEPDWGGPAKPKAAFLDRALTQAAERIGPFFDERPGVLVGWSRGAYAARDILEVAADEPDSPRSRRFSGLVLLAASVSIPAARLRAAGIRRVVFAAGDHDGARQAMTSNAASLRSAGLETRYVSLGPIGHSWPRDFESRMSEPIAWASRSPD